MININYKACFCDGSCYTNPDGRCGVWPKYLDQTDTISITPPKKTKAEEMREITEKVLEKENKEKEKLVKQWIEDNNIYQKIAEEASEGKFGLHIPKSEFPYGYGILQDFLSKQGFRMVNGTMGFILITWAV